MFIYEYNLSYIKTDEDGNIYYEDIDLTDFDFLKNEEPYSLKSIDKFTSIFKDAKELSIYLNREAIIDGSVSEFVITMNKKSVTKDGKTKKTIEKTIPISGRKIIYEKDKNKVNKQYINSWFMDSRNIDAIIEIMEQYSSKITKENSRTKKVYDNLKYIAKVIKKSDMSDEGYVLIDQLRYRTLKFMDTLTDKNEMITYKKMRDFIFYISKIKGEIIDIKENNENNPNKENEFKPEDIRFRYGNYDREEFITKKEDEIIRRRM